MLDHIVKYTGQIRGGIAGKHPFEIALSIRKSKPPECYTEDEFMARSVIRCLATVNIANLKGSDKAAHLTCCEARLLNIIVLSPAI